MATKKDLVEAHSFSRRRLVTAFLSGAPGGREVEPSRPGRTIVGGIALSILLVAGAAIASVLAARTPEDWNKPGLIVSRDNAALYVILKQEDPPVLRPILNVTSAQLIFGADKPPTYVSRDTVNEQTPGDTIGIFNAPAELPTTDGLIETGWTACTGDNLGIKLDLDRSRRVSPGTGAAFVVQTTDDQKYYLITTGRDEGGLPRARYYPIPDGTDDTLFADLGLPVRSEAMKVPGSWLRLFEPGGTLGWEGFRIPDPGAALPPALAEGQLAKEKAKVGDYIEGSDGGGTVLTSQGPVTLDPFALAVYRNSQVPGTGSTPRPLPDDTEIPPGAGFGQRAYLDAHWPDRSLETPPGQACAVLTPTYGDTPAVQLAVDPSGSASAEDVRPDEKEIRVQPGNGAFVYSGTFSEKSSTTAFVIDAKGDIYPLIESESISRLGYAKVKAPLVPDTWTSLFDEGVALSTTSALCPPDPDPDAGDQTCATLEETAPAASGSP